jgi:hypothetical protein
VFAEKFRMDKKPVRISPPGPLSEISKPPLPGAAEYKPAVPEAVRRIALVCERLNKETIGIKGVPIVIATPVAAGPVIVSESPVPVVTKFKQALQLVPTSPIWVCALASVVVKTKPRTKTTRFVRSFRIM